MVFDPSVLDHMSRDELIAQARVLGTERAELLTRVELRDEIVRRSASDVVERQRLRGFLGVARDLVANVMEAGLNLPEAAARIRGETPREEWRGPTPVATVTLAEIYVTQGHVDRALALLDQILEKEPEHEAARELKASLGDAPKRKRSEPEPSEPAPPEPEPETLAPAPPPPPRAGAVPAPLPASASANPCLVALSAPDGTLYLYWELSPALGARSDLVVRVVTFAVSGSAVQRAERELPVSSERGGERVTLAPGALVRAALGYQRNGQFVPLVVASQAEVASGDVLSPAFRPRWAPESAFDSSERRALRHMLGRS
jgi:hypothetical protein